MEQKIINGDCLEEMKKLKDNSVDLVVIDPPYNIGIDEWDKIENYYDWMEEVFIEIERVLKKTGSFYFFHNDFLKMVQLQNILNKKSFVFKQLLVWDKFNGTKPGAFGRVSRGISNFPKQAEYCLYYIFVKYNNEPVGNEDIRDYFLEERNKISDSLTKINKIAFSATNGKDGMAGNILSPYKKGWSFPSREKYELLNKHYGICNESYDELKDKYKCKSGKIKMHTFNCQGNASVIQFPHESPNGHITPKPVKLIETMIKTSSNEGDVVLDCFMGSGTTGVACKNLNRNFIGMELDEKYFEIAKQRIEDSPKP
jgi:site-specific DNA-methyltransferase (adenine-specific)